MAESLVELQNRHRKEQRDIQARITQKKKAVTKKTRKGVNIECEDLERQLKERQDQERVALNGEATPEIESIPELDDEIPSAESVASRMLAPADAGTAPLNGTPNDQPRKRNRAKERLARRAAEQDAIVAEAEAEAANQPDQKEVERKAILEEMRIRGLVEKAIRPDGHCLFSAVADQLSQVGIPLGGQEESAMEHQRYTVVRKAAAGYIEEHPDDFMAWLEEPLPQYVSKIRDTAEWGGHLELLALAKAYNVEICVVQNGASEHIRPDLNDSKKLDQIWLAYYRHGYGLGEHYNSLRKIP